MSRWFVAGVPGLFQSPLSCDGFGRILNVNFARSYSANMRFEAQTTLTFFPHIVIMSVIAYFTFKYFKPNSKQASPLIVPRSIDELAGSHATICTTDRCTIISKSTLFPFVNLP
jgi:hypothetical protein